VRNTKKGTKAFKLQEETGGTGCSNTGSRKTRVQERGGKKGQKEKKIHPRRKSQGRVGKRKKGIEK